MRSREFTPPVFGAGRHGERHGWGQKRHGWGQKRHADITKWAYAEFRGRTGAGDAVGGAGGRGLRPVVRAERGAGVRPRTQRHHRGIVINRPLEQLALESSALALLFVPEPNAPAFWGEPMGDDPLILAHFSAVDGLDYYHLPIRRRRPFVLPDVGLIAAAEHADAFDGRIRRARLFVGMCVWERGQLEAEIDLGAWQLAQPTADDLFTPDPAGLWARLHTQRSTP
jgi:putative AlgH/UPF0301 family transcriptional regulator